MSSLPSTVQIHLMKACRKCCGWRVFNLYYLFDDALFCPIAASKLKELRRISSSVVNGLDRPLRQPGHTQTDTDK